MRGSLILALSMIAPSIAWGQSTAATTPEYSPDEFVRAILKGPLPCPAGMSLTDCEANPKTRRFSLPSQAGPPERSAMRPRPAASAPRRVSAGNILVTFAVGSAEITPAGLANLKSVAAGLNAPALAGLRFEVAGYTDVTGSPDTNAELSKRRAEAVKSYLAKLSVSPSRLSATGFGSEHLANPDAPAAEENRRVELHRLN